MPALIVGQEGLGSPELSVQTTGENINDALNQEFVGMDAPEFPFWNNIGTVGLGTGVYLGDGWVLTSAHVGCFPFLTSDGKRWDPVKGSWQQITSAPGIRADVAIFRIAGRPDLPSIPVARLGLDAATPLVLVGNGFSQEAKAESIEMNGKIVGILGFQTKPVRAKTWGRAFIANGGKTENVNNKEGSATAAFVTRLERKAYSCQATDGDSGGAAFAFNARSRQWEIAGTIIGVSHQSRYVPYGSKTFVAALAPVDATAGNPGFVTPVSLLARSVSPEANIGKGS